MTPIVPVTLSNVSNKMIKKGSAVSDLANSVMKEFEGVTPAKAKKSLPKQLETNVAVKGETKQKTGMCYGSGEWYGACYPG